MYEMMFQRASFNVSQTFYMMILQRLVDNLLAKAVFPTLICFLPALFPEMAKCCVR